MGQISYTIPTAGSTLNSVADPEVATALQTLLTLVNGNIDATNIAPSLAQSAAVNQNAQTVKGAVSIATSESRTNTAYGTLATPDQVTGIVLPTSGLIRVWYQATWQESVASAGRAAIFVNGNQQTITSPSPHTVAAATNNVGSATALPLSSSPLGLATVNSGIANSGDLTTGQAVGIYGIPTYEVGSAVNQFPSNTGVGGPCDIFAAAGTYTVAVMFKASSGSVTASNRKLWVQALAFS